MTLENMLLYSFLFKVKKELNDNKDEIKREEINIQFDCRSNINQDLSNFQFDNQIIIFRPPEN